MFEEIKRVTGKGVMMKKLILIVCLILVLSISVSADDFIIAYCYYPDSIEIENIIIKDSKDIFITIQIKGWEDDKYTFYFKKVKFEPGIFGAGDYYPDKIEFREWSKDYIKFVKQGGFYMAKNSEQLEIELVEKAECVVKEYFEYGGDIYKSTVVDLSNILQEIKNQQESYL